MADQEGDETKTATRPEADIEREATSGIRKIPDDLVFAELRKDKLAQMYLPIRTVVRLIAELDDCKTRYAPAWSNAIWALIGLFLPTLVSAITDISVQHQNNRPLTATVPIVFTVIFFVALVLSVAAYFTTNRAENASVERVAREMRGRP